MCMNRFFFPPPLVSAALKEMLYPYFIAITTAKQIVNSYFNLQNTRPHLDRYFVCSSTFSRCTLQFLAVAMAVNWTNSKMFCISHLDTIICKIGPSFKKKTKKKHNHPLSKRQLQNHKVLGCQINGLWCKDTVPTMALSNTNPLLLQELTIMVHCND